MRRNVLTLSLMTGWLCAAVPFAAAQTPSSSIKELDQQYRQLATALDAMAQKLERRNIGKDKENAARIRKALEQAQREGVENRFDRLVSLVVTGDAVTIQDLTAAAAENRQLAESLTKVLAILLKGDEAALLRARIEKNERILKRLKALIRKTKVQRALVESGRGKKDRLSKAQKKLAKQTKDLAKAMGNGKNGQPKPGQPKPGSGKPKPGQPKSGQPKPGQPKPGQPKPQEPNKDDTPGRKKVQQAAQKQREVVQDIDQDDKQQAVKKLDDIIKKLEEAKEDIEERLRQDRDKELLRLLENLQNRIRRMLTLQIEVRDGTRELKGQIEGNADGKPTRNNRQRAQELSDKEGLIVNEADKAIQLLMSEGSAVAFPQVLDETKIDMMAVQNRLYNAVTNDDTIMIEEDVIDALKEMLEALKKEIKKQKKKKPGEPNGGQPQDQKLIDILAELKMIRSLQFRVNKRTQRYAMKYKGEQAEDQIIRGELRQLGERQKRIERMTYDLAVGKNR